MVDMVRVGSLVESEECQRIGPLWATLAFGRGGILTRHGNR